MPSSFITSQIDLIHYNQGEDAFYVNPVEFSKRVVHEIKTNFTVFDAMSSPNHPLSSVKDEETPNLDFGNGPGGTGVL